MHTILRLQLENTMAFFVLWMTNEDLMRFLLEKIKPNDMAFLVFVYSFLEADLQVILHGLKLVFQAARKRNIDLFNSENEYYVGDIVCDIITEQLPIRNDIFGLMFRYGLSSNSEIGDKPFYLFALQYRDYSTMELLMFTPGFSLTPELLSEFNKEVEAIDRLREQMISRLHPGRQPLKRSRYELD